MADRPSVADPMTGPEMRTAGPLPPCPTGCTDDCPEGAEAHAKQVRASIDPRIQHEWPAHKRPTLFTDESRWTPIEEPGGLPEGWQVVSTWEHFGGRRATDLATRLHVVHAPPRPARRRLFRSSPPVPAVWGLVEQTHDKSRPDLRLAEVNLWRLWQMASMPRMPYWPMPYEGWPEALEWLRGLVVDRFDLADENERAEHTLYLLSGRIRTPPAAACH